MKILFRINLILLILLSLSTGVFKIIQQEADVVLFEKIGIGLIATTILGIIQFAGGILLVMPGTRKYGAVVMIPTFVIASVAVFANGMIVFGMVSLLFIVMSIMEIVHQNQNHE